MVDGALAAAGGGALTLEAGAAFVVGAATFDAFVTTRGAGCAGGGAALDDGASTDAGGSTTRTAVGSGAGGIS